MNTIRGQCHCGNLSFEVDTEMAPTDIVARACDCSFCRMQGAKSFSDPNGQARVSARDANEVKRYQFGHHAIDFLICRTCGAYAGGVLEQPDGVWVTLNLRLTALREADDSAAHYDNQSREERTRRRRRMWTPAVLRGV